MKCIHLSCIPLKSLVLLKSAQTVSQSFPRVSHCGFITSLSFLECVYIAVMKIRHYRNVERKWWDFVGDWRFSRLLILPLMLLPGYIHLEDRQLNHLKPYNWLDCVQDSFSFFFSFLQQSAEL